MPTVDMPIQRLKEYKGINPLPEDFDAYWDRALSEMRSINPDVRLVESTFKCPGAICCDMYFTGVRGAKVHAKLLKPKNQTGKAPAIIMFHGYTGSAGDWSDKLSYALNGFYVAALDCRGQGGLSEDTGGVAGTTLRGHIVRGLDDTPDNLLFRHVFLDTAQLASIIMDMPEVDETRVGVKGGSQGGGLSLVCAALEPRINRISSAYPFLSDYKRIWEMDLMKDAYDELNFYFRRFDPLHRREDEIFTKLGYIDVQHLACRIKGEVLMGTGLMDTVCPPSTQFAAYNKITSRKSMTIYPDFGHEGLPGFDDITYEFMMGLL